MKYYTKEWCYSRMEDEKIEEIQESYLAYIQKVYDTLPFTLKSLVSTIQLHDGFVNFFSLDSLKKQLILSGIIGDLQSGYYELKLEYTLSKDLSLSEFKQFKNQYVTVLSDEVEHLSDNLNVHRILFDNEKEIEIIFTQLSMTITDAKPNDYKKQLCLVEAI